MLDAVRAEQLDGVLHELARLELARACGASTDSLPCETETLHEVLWRMSDFVVVQPEADDAGPAIDRLQSQRQPGESNRCRLVVEHTCRRAP